MQIIAARRSALLQSRANPVTTGMEIDARFKLIYMRSSANELRDDVRETLHITCPRVFSVALKLSKHLVCICNHQKMTMAATIQSTGKLHFVAQFSRLDTLGRFQQKSKISKSNSFQLHL